MKRKLVLIGAAIALVAAMAFPALALAQSQGPATATVPRITGSLAIVAPRAAAVGTRVQMTVFRAWDQATVADAGVWAVTKDRLQTIKDEIAKLKGKSPDEAAPAAEQALNANATLIGRTDSSGKVLHVFNDAGQYLLVAFKPGFLPDFRPIVIGAPRPAFSALTIEAPNRADIGAKVAIKVVQKGTHDGVKDAKVWALTRERAQTLKTQIAGVNPEADATTFQSQVESTLNAAGAIFLGTTNGNGKLEPQPSFQSAGGYLLVTFKAGYRPGLKVILITNIVPRQGNAQTNQGK